MPEVVRESIVELPLPVIAVSRFGRCRLTAADLGRADRCGRSRRRGWSGRGRRPTIRRGDRYDVRRQYRRFRGRRRGRDRTIIVATYASLERRRRFGRRRMLIDRCIGNGRNRTRSRRRRAATPVNRHLRGLHREVVEYYVVVTAAAAAARGVHPRSTVAVDDGPPPPPSLVVRMTTVPRGFHSPRCVSDFAIAMTNIPVGAGRSSSHKAGWTNDIGRHADNAATRNDASRPRRGDDVIIDILPSAFFS